LANIGIGNAAVDGGAGYTYFGTESGYEFSVVTGLTYNLVNPSTNYQNGIDWGASQFMVRSGISINSLPPTPAVLQFSARSSRG
jgi:hypothetical protein